MLAYYLLCLRVRCFQVLLTGPPTKPRGMVPMKKTTLQVAAALGIMAATLPADATLTLRAGFQNSALSIDAFGGSSGTLQVDIPAGAIVQRALLYSSDVSGSGLSGNITFQGN